MGHTGRYIPNNLKRYRKMYGYRQEEVMKFLGLKSSNRISRWEKGLAMPSAKNLLRLSILYHTLVDQLYSDLIKDMKRNLSERHKLLVSSHHKQHHEKK